MEKTYEINCTKCKTGTNHTAIKVSRKKGLRLRCERCGKIKLRYSKLNTLVEVEKLEPQFGLSKNGA